MSNLWLEQSDSFEMCQRCSGTGRLPCSRCAGAGSIPETSYDRDYEGRSITRSEFVSCSSCAGSGDTICSCGGGGSIQKTSPNRSRSRQEADTEEPFDSYEVGEPHRSPARPEESLSEYLVRDFSDRVSEIQDSLRDSQLSSVLKNDWHERLQEFSVAFALHSIQQESSLLVGNPVENLAAKVETFYKEVRTARQECLRKADISNSTRAMDVDRDFDGLEYKIGNLGKFLARLLEPR